MRARSWASKKIALAAVMLAVMICGRAFAAMSDDEFIDLCVGGSPSQIADAIENGANVNARDGQEATALMYAVSFNSAEAVRKLLEKGADLHARDIFGSEALVYCNISNAEIIHVLVGAGADVNARSNNGMTVLMWAANSSKAPVISALLAAGADVNAADPDGFTSLIWAAQSNGPEEMAALLDAGADARPRAKNGKSALDYAGQNEKLRGTAVYERLTNLQTRNSAPPITAAVFTWENMGLMGPGDESGHKITVRRDDPSVSHEITYNDGAGLRVTKDYITGDGPRGELLALLAEAYAKWHPKYEAPVLDGSSWSLSVEYGGGRSDVFRGYGETPPRAGEIKELLLKLAEYEVKPKLF